MPKININGVTREMTPEEIAEYEAMIAAIPIPEPTLEERNRADIDYLLMLTEEE